MKKFRKKIETTVKEANSSQTSHFKIICQWK